MSSLNRRKYIGLVAILGIVVACFVFAALPSIISRLAYAAESGQALAAKEQLAHATDLSKGFQYVAKAMRPSVVSISSVRKIQPAANRSRPELRQIPDEFRGFFDEDLFDRFFEFRIPEGGFEQRGLGSGVIIRPDGYILTNNHVVQQADEINITLSDERTFKATVVGTDDKTDLAVLKIEASGLVPAEIGNSDRIDVGEWVLAIGSPFGLDQTVTAGIISAKGRSDVGITDYEDFIQTDAAINPGNSGGPLVNLKGQVVGINTAIASRNGTYMGVGFAIPSNMAQMVTSNIIEHGKVQRGWLGAAIQDLNESLSQSFGFQSQEGVLIGDVVADGPADKAGIQSGDIITKFSGKDVAKAYQLRNAVASTTPDTTVDVVLFRDGKYRTVQVVVGELGSGLGSVAGREATIGLGITAQTLTPEIARQLGYPENETGVVVTSVEPGSLAAQVGIQPQDILVAAGNTPIRNIEDFREAMKDQDLSQGIRIQVKREGMRRFVFLKSSR
ncbi:MAG: Do family serine endopeptidase [Pirellulales bacterium]|nr:Do family serine endopeptidase [Pirellulales bacterium]